MVSETGTYEWKVSDDRLSVLVKVPEGQNDQPDPETVISKIEAEEIVATFDRETLSAELSDPTGEWVVVGRGTPPTPPVDGRLEYLIDLDFFENPIQADENSNVDFKDLNLVLNVKEGEPLVRRHDGVPGTPGTDVRGAPVEPRPPKEVKIPKGEGVEIIEEGRLAVASQDGAITTKMPSTLEHRGRGEAVRLFENEEDEASAKKKLRGRMPALTVSKVYHIPSDVGYKTGNVDFNGTVQVTGNVLSGFNVSATEDIVVSGLVEASVLKAGGSVTIAGGIQGGGKGRIAAGQSITAKFANECELKAGVDVKVRTHLINCRVFGGECVHVTGFQGVIAGGEVRAGDEISSYTLGSEIGVKTILQIGLDDDLLGKIKEIEETIENETEKLAKVQEVLFKLGETKEQSGTFGEEEEKVRIECVRNQFRIMGGLDTTNRALRQCEIDLERCRNGRVVVENNAFPGVRVRFLGKGEKVAHEVRHLAYYFEDGEIRSKAI